MDYLPIFLSVRAQPALVVGGGEVAARKVEALLKAGARVQVIAPAICAVLQERVARQEIDWVPRTIAPTADIGNQVLVISAADDPATNQTVAAAARQCRIPVNVVDAPALCSFIMPALVDRDPVLVAISSGGHSPVLARALRRRLESELPQTLGRLAEFIGRQRSRIRERLPARAVRAVWERFIDGPGAEAVLNGRESAAEACLENLLQAEGNPQQGAVYLIGAGPGDPDLLTFRALRLLQKADVVLHDRLVSPEVLDKARRDAERIYVGKARAAHSLRQQEINRLMIALARAGKTVVRLKGGDPFIFGRGGEEIEELAAAGIPFQVVPGITAASGCAAYAGIPLTHRDHASSVRFLAGNLHNEQYSLNWPELNRPGETLVFYMGLDKLPEISRALLAHGKPPDTAVAIVEEGTRPQQRVIVSTLDRIVEAAEVHAVHAPTLIIMGSVVTLYRQLAWFGDAGSYLNWP